MVEKEQAPASGPAAPTTRSATAQAATTQSAPQAPITVNTTASFNPAPTSQTQSGNASSGGGTAPAAAPSQAAIAQAASKSTRKASKAKKNVGPAKPQVFKQLVHAKNSTSKHTPIAPRGTIILQKDNLTISTKPFKKGSVEPEKLKLTLKDTKGNLHKRFFADKDSMDWNDSKMISDANKWRNQVLRRMLKRDPTFQGRTIRAKWGIQETESLKTELKKKIGAVGNRKLTATEWDSIVKAHNGKYQGKIVHKGDRLVGGTEAKTEETIAERTVVAIKALFDRNADLKAFLNDLTGVNAEDDDEDGAGEGLSGGEVEDDEETEEEDEENPRKKHKGEHGGVIDPRLEESSEDEDDGQQPASNPTGAVLVSA